MLTDTGDGHVIVYATETDDLAQSTSVSDHSLAPSTQSIGPSRAPPTMVRSADQIQGITEKRAVDANSDSEGASRPDAGHSGISDWSRLVGRDYRSSATTTESTAETTDGLSSDTRALRGKFITRK